MTRNSRHGRGARTPWRIPGAGWRDILWRVKDQVSADHVTIVSAGVAFFGLLALFPAIASLVAIAGLVMDPSQITGQIETLAAALPENAAEIVRSQARQVAGAGGTGAGIGAALGILFSLYSASKGMKSLIEGMNIAYDETEDRGFVVLNLVALGLTFVLIAGALIALSAALAAPALLGSLGLGAGMQTVLAWGRWPLLAILAMLGLAVVYRVGPSRKAPRWRWVSPGALLATVLWIVASVGFSIYVGNFGRYNETYGTLGGVIVLLIWLWLSALAVLLGAEVNAEAERQTRRDTTTDTQDAAKADTPGRSP